MVFSKLGHASLPKNIILWLLFQSFLVLCDSPCSVTFRQQRFVLANCQDSLGKGNTAYFSVVAATLLRNGFIFRLTSKYHVVCNFTLPLMIGKRMLFTLAMKPLNKVWINFIERAFRILFIC